MIQPPTAGTSAKRRNIRNMKHCENWELHETKHFRVSHERHTRATIASGTRCRRCEIGHKLVAGVVGADVVEDRVLVAGVVKMGVLGREVVLGTGLVAATVVIAGA